MARSWVMTWRQFPHARTGCLGAAAALILPLLLSLAHLSAYCIHLAVVERTCRMVWRGRGWVGCEGSEMRRHRHRARRRARTTEGIQSPLCFARIRLRARLRAPHACHQALAILLHFLFPSLPCPCTTPLCATFAATMITDYSTAVE